MSLWKIAWRSIQQRSLASLLTTISMALGMALVVAVLVVIGVVSDSFRSNAGLGYNLVVGPKGGRLDLVLNTVYYLDKPIGKIPYALYQDFTEGRFRAYTEVAIPVCLGDYFEGYRVIGTTPDFFDKLDRNGQKFEFAQGQNFSGEWSHSNVFSGVVGAAVAAATGLKLGDEFQPAHSAGQDAHKHDPFKVVGILKPTGSPVDRGVFINLEGFYLLDNHAKPVDETPPPEREHRDLGAARESEHGHDHEHGHEHEAAQREPTEAAPSMIPRHDEPADRDEHDHDEHEHEHGAKADADHGHEHDAEHGRGESGHGETGHGETGHGEPGHGETDAMESDHEHADHEHAGDDHAEHEHGEHGAEHDHAEHDHDHHHDHFDKPLPNEQREVTAVLVRSGGFGGVYSQNLYKEINDGIEAQAVMPIREITELMETFVAPTKWLLIGISGLVVLVSGIGILVSIYNSMSDRRREIAIMRALGAGRGTVMRIVLLESILLSLAGGVAGWFIGHGLISGASSWIAAKTGVAMGFWQVGTFEVIIPGGSKLTLPYEAIIVPGLVALAALVGFLPAVAAYRTDVGKSLAANP